MPEKQIAIFRIDFSPPDPQRERPKLNLAKRSAPVGDAEKSTSSAIFGGAKPVDTSAKEREIEEKLQKQQVKTPRSRTTSEKSNEEPAAASAPVAEHQNNKPSPFGGAKPVNTSKREREIEEKLRNVDINPADNDNKNRRNNQSRNKNEAPTAASGSEKKVRSPPPPKKVEEDQPPVSHY